MSGTSLDGVDAALIQTDGTRILRDGPALTVPYTPELRARLRHILDAAPQLAPSDPALLSAEHDLTEVHAIAVQQLRQMAPDMPADIIGFHG